MTIADEHLIEALKQLNEISARFALTGLHSLAIDALFASHPDPVRLRAHFKRQSDHYAELMLAKATWTDADIDVVRARAAELLLSLTGAGDTNGTAPTTIDRAQQSTRDAISLCSSPPQKPATL